MIYKQLNEPIEYTILASSVNYRLFISGETTPFYTGKAYAYPNTNIIVLRLNELFETQLSFDSFNPTINWEIGDGINYKVMDSFLKDFTLEVSETTFGTGSTFEQYRIHNTYNQIGDSNNVGVVAEWSKIPSHEAQEVYIDNPVYLTYMTGDTGTTTTKRYVRVHTYVNGVLDDIYQYSIQADKNKVVMLNKNISELYTAQNFINSDFNNSIGWTTSGGSTISGGTANIISVAGAYSGIINTAYTYITGKKYQLSYYVLSATTGNIVLQIGGGIEIDLPKTLGLNTVTFTAQGDEAPVLKRKPSQITNIKIETFVLSEIPVSNNVTEVGFTYMDYWEYGGTWSECARFKITNCRPKYTLYWINQYGGVEFLNGTDASKLNSQNTITDTKINYRTFTGTEVVGDQSSLGVRRSINNTQTYQFQTQLLTDVEHKYIESLYMTTQAWIWDNSQWNSVLPTDTNFDLKMYKTDKLINRTINLKKQITNYKR